MTGFGHPDWVRTHEPASSTCPVVSTLVEGGATCVGKTVVDELAFRFLLYRNFKLKKSFFLSVSIIRVVVQVIVLVFVFFSISGETKHYESPTNPAAHDRIPGGACSGAAVAVATNAVDFALG